VDKALFTSFTYYLASPENGEDEEDSPQDAPTFELSLPSLLETLQIFGASEASTRFQKNDSDGYTSNIRPNRPSAFSNQNLGITGVCRFSYSAIGEPFSIILEEAGVITTCNLNTYESEFLEEIPFNKQELELKIIMQARFLHDALVEISSITASSGTPFSRLRVIASPNAPYFALSAVGALGSVSVEFGKSRELLERLDVTRRWTQYYKLVLVKAAIDAMRVASKVSIRGDRQGVLSLQFMVEVEGGGISYVDFRFVPYVEGEEDTDGEIETDEDYEDDDESQEI
jgi:cell cycle checkpoint protein